MATLSVVSAPTAHAADGCKFLLCIAGPWSSIAECRETVHEVFRDMARGRGIPSCGMSGDGNRANNTSMSESTCPIMYRYYNPESGTYAGCSFRGRVSVYVNGALWSNVYWNTRGETSTWYSDEARASLTTPESLPLDDTFRNDVASWNAYRERECRGGGGSAVYGEFGAYESCSYPDWGGGS